MLDHYWNVERAAYVKHSSRADVAVFKPLWKALSQLFQARKKEIAAERGSR